MKFLSNLIARIALNICFKRFPFGRSRSPVEPIVSYDPRIVSLVSYVGIWSRR